MPDQPVSTDPTQNVMPPTPPANPPGPAQTPVTPIPEETGGFPPLVEDATVAPPPPVVVEETSTTSTIAPAPKKKFGTGKIIATIFGIMILLIGGVAGVVLVQRNQELREKAQTVGNNCCGQTDYQNGHDGQCTDPFMWEAGYQACVAGGCAICRTTTGPTAPPGSPCNNDGLCRSGENETVCPNDCGPGGVDKNPPVVNPPTGPTVPPLIDLGSADVCDNDSCTLTHECYGTNDDYYCDCFAEISRCPDSACQGPNQNNLPCNLNPESCSTVGCTKSIDPNACGIQQLDVRCFSHNGVSMSGQSPSSHTVDYVWYCNPNTNCGTVVTPTPTPTAPPGGGPTPTPPIVGPTAQCSWIKAYDTNWVELTPAQLATLQPGDHVYFTVMGSTTSGSFDKARFTINATLRPEVTTTKPGESQTFYDDYVIPTGVTTFSVQAEIHHASLGWE